MRRADNEKSRGKDTDDDTIEVVLEALDADNRTNPE